MTIHSTQVQIDKMMRACKICLAFSILLLLMLSGSGLAEDIPETQSPQRGFYPAGSYDLSDIETINTENGNLMFHVPLASLPKGRGNNPGFQLNLVYNSKLFDMTPYQFHWSNSTSTDNVIELKYLKANPDGGWNYNNSYALELEDRADLDPDGIHCGARGRYVYRFKLRLPDGSLHEMHPQVPQGYGGSPADFDDYLQDGFFSIRPDGYIRNQPDCGALPVDTLLTTSSLFYYSTDNTHLRLEMIHDTDELWFNNPWNLYLPDGGWVQDTPDDQRIYDRNGNWIIFQGNLIRQHLDDQLDEELPGKITITHNGGIDTIEAPGANGTTLTWQVKWKLIDIDHEYRLAPTPPNYTDQFPLIDEFIYSFPVVDEITLPNPSDGTATGLKYVFGYTGNPLPVSSPGWGELNSISLPSLAQADYNYLYNTASLFPGSDNDADRVLDNHILRRDLTYDARFDNSTTETTDSWTYSKVTVTAGEWYHEITGPDGGKVRDWYCVDLINPGLDYLNRRTEKPDGSVVERLWADNAPYGVSIPRKSPVNPFVKTEFFSVKDGGGNLSQTAIKDYKYDKNGNLTQVMEYDWIPYSSVPRENGYPTGVPGGTPVKKVTVSEYFNPTPDSSNTGTDDPNVYHKNLPLRPLNLVASSENRSTTSKGNVFSRTEYTYDNPGSTGNLTSQRSWDSFKGGTARVITRPLNDNNSIALTHTYGEHGNLTSTTNATGCTTNFTYDAINGVANLYPTKIEECVNAGTYLRTTQLHYDFGVGIVDSRTDVENNIATHIELDNLGRPKTLKEAYGIAGKERWTQTEYHDAERIVEVRSDLKTTGDGKLVSAKHYDQLGRLWLSRQLEDAASQNPLAENDGIKIQTLHKYSGTNSYTLTSNPYRAATSATESDSSMGWTLTRFDQGGRVQAVTTYEGGAAPAPWGTNPSSTGTVPTSYDAEYTTVYDQAGKPRRSRVDGLGRLVRVDEPNASNDLGSASAPAQPTVYEYDALSNLLSVTQGIQSRSYSYSSLSRLISATNPESGTVSYAYDSDGNLTDKTDARGTNTHMVYDPLDRLVQTTYTPAGGTASTPTATYGYGLTDRTIYCGNYSIGRLCSAVALGLSDTQYSQYDPYGRAGQTMQTTAGQSYTMLYQYNLAGGVTSMAYPSGRVVRTEYDKTGRIAGVGREDGSFFFVGAGAGDLDNQMHYAANGAPMQVKLGNNLWEETRYNGRMQPRQFGLGQTKTNIVDPDLNADNSNRWLLGLAYAGDCQASNNGNVARQTISIGATTITQDYCYDSLNRLQTTNETRAGYTGWTQVFAYDPYGNRAVTTGSELSATPLLVPSTLDKFNPGNNRMLGPSEYDAAGNLTKDDVGRQFEYDGENRQTKFIPGLGLTNTEYYYDAEGHRVKEAAADQTTVFVYSAMGQMVAEYTGQVPQGAGGVNYVTVDHLGSTRVVTDDGGNIVTRHDYLPFGEEVPLSLADYGGRFSITGYTPSLIDGPRQKFTAKERDTESNLDYFRARYYSGAQGRFTSPDLPLSDQYPEEPQSWNLYSYVRNNPVRFRDQTGRDCVTLDNGSKGDNGEGTPCKEAQLETSQQITVTAEKGNPLVALALNTAFALSNVSNDYFAWMFNRRPNLLQNTPTNKEFTGQIATILAVVGTSLIGPEGEASQIIRITEAGLKHVLETHAVGGAETLGKSIFHAGEDIPALIKSAESVAPVKQAGGNLERIVEAGRTIGTDRATGQATSTYTVITRPSGDLVTAFPGRP